MPAATSHAHLRDLLRSSRQVHAAPSAGQAHVRLRQGLYVQGSSWSDLTARDRLIMRAYAVDRHSAESHVFSHHTSAALWGLPIIGRWPTLVERVAPAGVKGRSPDVRRRRTERPPRSVEVGGVRVTPVVRTVIDLAREVTLESALASIDHALRHGLCDRRELEQELNKVPRGARGRLMAARAVHLADPLSESPGESLSRARMYQLNLPRPRTQVRLYDEDGEAARVDFWWEHLGLAGEFDGFVKYQVPEGATAEEAAAVLWKEKRREDRIRRTDGRRVGRWVWDEVLPLERFRQIMTRLGVHDRGGDPWQVG
ncbi:hypothetical protein [Luteipulveratus flavus]|uniref:Transcriptional regulator, AbiEi antitoxin, Type IV TA system n=1 Tax=Luteipulveratus flavus TaxID=3031728 RepID=A0ABT6C9W9_9MICO|nr:hypothetical protein [Luteipulveratus sp. YIM 133296]MDF8265696.1 hypothetical protein [Luteipulveratus sp. YIM 133296]